MIEWKYNLEMEFRTTFHYMNAHNDIFWTFWIRKWDLSEGYISMKKLQNPKCLI
jgi:hypothetical protein